MQFPLIVERIISRNSLTSFTLVDFSAGKSLLIICTPVYTLPQRKRPSCARIFWAKVCLLCHSILQCVSCPQTGLETLFLCSTLDVRERSVISTNQTPISLTFASRGSAPLQKPGRQSLAREILCRSEDVHQHSRERTAYSNNGFTRFF